MNLVQRGADLQYDLKMANEHRGFLVVFRQCLWHFKGASCRHLKTEKLRPLWEWSLSQYKFIKSGGDDCSSKSI